MLVAAENIGATRAAHRKSGELSYFSYLWKCVAGAEVAYFLCLTGAFVVDRTADGAELHHTLFETLPGFVWLTPASILLGAIYMFLFAVVFGGYMVWMHNSSIRD